MVKVVARNRGGTFQRLVVMTEKEYEQLRAVSILLNKKPEIGNPLVEKYLGDNANPDLNVRERLTMFNQAVAREEATRQFSDGRYTTVKPRQVDAPTITQQQQLVDVSKTTSIAEEAPTNSTVDAKNEEAVEAEAEQEQDTKDVKVDTLPPLPDVRIQVVHGLKMAALKTILEKSGTVSVDKDGRVYINNNLLDVKSNYFDLMRSLFVHSKKAEKLAGRKGFFEHLNKLGISEKQVVTRSAKLQLQQLKSQTGGIMPSRTTEGCGPPGKRPKVLLMYR